MKTDDLQPEDEHILRELRQLDAPPLSEGFYERLRSGLATVNIDAKSSGTLHGARWRRAVILVAAVAVVLAGLSGAGIGYAVAPKHRSFVVVPPKVLSGHPTTIPGPQFATKTGWTADQTGSHSSSDEDTPVGLASTIPVTGADTFPAFPTSTLAALPADGIVLWATAYPPFGPTSGFFPPRALPLKLADTAEIDRQWEGQPKRTVPQYVLLASVDGIQLDVRVYFGTQHPGADLIAEAQDELDSLTLR